MLRGRLTTRVSQALTVGVALAGWACWRDDPIQGPRVDVPSRASFTTVTPIGNAPLSIPGNNLNGAVQAVSSTGITVPAGTYYRVRVVGTVTASRNGLYGSCFPTHVTPWVGTWGPAGTPAYELIVQLQWRYASGGSPSPLAYASTSSSAIRSDIKYADQDVVILAGRTGIAGAGSHPTCAPSPGVGAYDLSSNQTVYVEKVTDVAHLVASPSYIKTPTQVTFTASRDDSLTLQVQSWHWQPNGGSAITPCWWLNPCQMTVSSSGTMTVYTNVGPATAQVTLYSNFDLDADKSTVAPGDTVAFTPKYDGVAGPAACWQWVPDTGSPDAKICNDASVPRKMAMTTSGTMWAFTAETGGESDSKHVSVVVPTLTLTASPSSGVAPASVTFTPSWSDGHPITAVTQWVWVADILPGASSVSCGTSTPCATTLAETGTMTVWVIRNGQPHSAQAHVNVRKCPTTGDPKLDSPDVRGGFMEMMRLSNPDAPPGSGINPADWVNTGNKKEKGVWIYQRADGSYYTQPATGTATECSFNPNPPPSPHQPGDSYVGLAHTHPTSTGELLYGACNAVDANGKSTPVKRYPGDAGQQGKGGDEAVTGGGSFADWALASDPTYTAYGVDIYVMTKDGEVWKLPSGWTWNQRKNNLNNRRKEWSTSTCTWP